jgi:hypothetical protein
MLDYKSAAAVDQQSQTGTGLTDRPKKTSVGYQPEYLDFILDSLISVTQATLSGTDRAVFKAKLSTFPRWKLERIIDFNGKFISEIWAFLASIQSPPASTYVDYRKLPEPRSNKSILCVRAYDDLQTGKITAQEYFYKISQI